MDSSTIFVLSSTKAIDSLAVFLLEFANKYLTRGRKNFSDFFLSEMKFFTQSSYPCHMPETAKIS